jgi:sodium/proline symporter
LTYPLQSWGQELSVQYSSDLAVVLVAVYGVLMIGIGLFATRYLSDEVGYFAAGRRGSLVVIALSYMAAAASGWGLIGVTGAVYLSGAEYLVLEMIAPLLVTLPFWLLARKMRTLGSLKNAITAPDALVHRYKDDRLRILGAVAVVLSSAGLIATQYAALGVVGALILPVGFLEALIIGVTIVAIYTVVGGMLAAIWSDTIQGSIMAVGGILAIGYVVFNFPGGTSGMVSALQENAPQTLEFSVLGGDPILGPWFLGTFLLLLLTLGGVPVFFTRFYMSRNVSTLRWGFLVAALTYAITTLYWWIGMYVRAGEAQGQFDVPIPDAALPVAMIEFAPPIVTALVLTAVIAAIMSTTNAWLNVAAAAVQHDILKEYLDRDFSSKEELRWGRVTTGVVVVLAFALAATFQKLIFVLGAAGFALGACVFFPGVVLGYNWRGGTAEGALWGGTIGLVATLLLGFGPRYLGLELPGAALGGPIGVLVGIAAYVVISIVTSTNDYRDLDDDDVKAVMDTGRIRGGPDSSPAAVTDGGQTGASDD